MPHFTFQQHQLHYENHGEGDRVVLLIHGLGSSIADWELNAPKLAEGRRVVMLDLLGHGRSDRPRDGYSIPAFAQQAAALLDHLGIAQADVVGISMGGMIGLQLALDFPQRVRSLVVCNAVPAVVLDNWRTRLLVWQRTLVGRVASMRQIGRFLGKRMFPKPAQAELRATFVERWAANDKPVYVAVATSIIGWSVRERAGEIACPTLILTGDRDFFPLPPKQQLADALPTARLQVVEDSGHATPADQPEAFNEAVIAFIAEPAGA